MFRFSAKGVHLVSHYMAQADIRYYLNGIYAEPAPGGGAFLVATDGHQMGVYYDAEALCEETVLFSLTKAGITACKPQRRVYNQVVEIKPHTQRLIIMGSRTPGSDPHEELYLQPGKCFIEGKFPDWKRVLKPFISGKAAESVTVNSAYMAKFFTATKPHCEKRFAAVSMFFKSESDAILLANGFIPEFQVLLMPMRDSSSRRMNPAIAKTLEAYVTTEAAKAQGGV